MTGPGRLMSVAETVEQVEARTKTVTRRLGWEFAKPGDRLQLVDRNPRSGKPWRVLARVEIIDVSREPLSAITCADVAAEGFPGSHAVAFARWYAMRFGVSVDSPVTRLEWRYLDEGNTA